MKRYIRRLQFTGKSTYIVSLPKSWVLNQGLNAKSQVVIEEKGGQLIIKPTVISQEKKEKTAVIQLDNESPEAISRRIISAYVMGFDRIILKFSKPITPLIRNSIRELIVNKTPGVEVISEDEREIHLFVLLNPLNTPLQDTIKRLVRVVRSIIQDACSYIRETIEIPMDQLVREDDSVDRVYFYTIRVLNKIAEGYMEVEDEKIDIKTLLAYRSLSKLLERIGDHAVNIALNTSKLKGREDIAREVSELCIEARDIYIESTESFLNAKPGVIDEIALKTSLLREKERKLFTSYVGSLDPQVLASLQLVLESIRRIAEYSKDIAELALDLAIDKILVKNQGGVTEDIES